MLCKNIVLFAHHLFFMKDQFSLEIRQAFLLSKKRWAFLSTTRYRKTVRGPLKFASIYTTEQKPLGLMSPAGQGHGVHPHCLTSKMMQTSLIAFIGELFTGLAVGHLNQFYHITPILMSPSVAAGAQEIPFPHRACSIAAEVVAMMVLLEKEQLKKRCSTLCTSLIGQLLGVFQAMFKKHAKVPKHFLPVIFALRFF